MSGFHQPSVLVVDILPVTAVTGVTVIVEKGFELVDVIGRQRKVVTLTELALRSEPGHLFTVVTVEAVPADHGGVQPFTGEHPAENLAGGGGSRTG